VAVVFASVAGHPAAAAEVPADKQALIMLRILAYDHALAARSGKAIRLAVVHAGGGAALGCATRMRSALDDLVKRVVVTGKKVEVETAAAVDVSGPALERREVSVLYVCGGADADLPALVKAARAAHALTFTDQLAYLAHGLSIALSEDGARVGISVNLVAARAEGARLAGQFLRLSKVVAR
jgi:hypothetical protein